MRPLPCIALTSLALAAGFSSATAAPSGQVWIVDDDPGGDFAEIQPAIVAASAGDVILVKEGLYATFSLDKGLAIVAEADETVRVDGTWRVDSVPAGEFALLRGLRSAELDHQGLVVVECDGSVWIEDCAITAADQPTSQSWPQLNHGIEVLDSNDVILARCTVTAGQGTNQNSSGLTTDGGSGVYALRSTVAVLDCELTGGHGASAWYDEWHNGGDGGSGVLLVGANAIVAGGSANCGSGGSGDEEFDLIWGTTDCGSGGDGGSGVKLDVDFDIAGSISSTATVRALDTLPGNGGDAICAPFGEPGGYVTTVSDQGHTFELLDGATRGFSVNSPVRGGGNARLTFSGAAGDLGFGLIGVQPLWLDLGSQPAPLASSGLFAVVGPHTIAAGGTTVVPIPVPVQAPGFGGATLPLQGAVLELDSGVLTLAPPSALTILNSIY